MAYQTQAHWRGLLLRTEETARAYEQHQQEKHGPGMCFLCKDTQTLEDYTYWRRMPNAYPYDRYCVKSDMLVLKRHSDERGVTQDERTELIALKERLGASYDHLLENLPAQMTIPHHYHIHLISFERPDATR